MCVYTCIHIYIYIYIGKHACRHVCMYVCVYVCMYECMYLCMYFPSRGQFAPQGSFISGAPSLTVRDLKIAILPPSEIDFGLCLAVFAGSGGKYLFHRIG